MMIPEFLSLHNLVSRTNAMVVLGLQRNGAQVPVPMLMFWFMKKLSKTQ